MLDRYLYYRDVLDNFVSKDKDIKVYNLSSAEWKKVNELHKFLKVFYEVTNSFSASNTPTANVYFHGVWKIHKKLDEVYNSPPSFLSTMVIDMHEKFNKYWSEYSLILSCAAVLDPRFKLERVEYCYSKLYGNVYAKEKIEDIKNTLFELYDEYKDVFGESSHFVKNTSNYDHVLGVNGRMDDEEDYATFLSKKRKIDAEKSELELYLEEKNVDLNEDLNVLLYWKKQSERFSCLSCLARDILTVPISTVPSESAFSMGKKLINPWRSSLSPQTIEALACHEDWLRAKAFSTGRSSIFGYGDDVLGEDENDEEDNDETPAM
ncbi:zinc finger BED domain-containing protein RICESLEEPER 3-like [Silene latifolia]|uniref:zinc finger BED domain-containing protein RICESLEEPER 3-like n=1 Tax=Silene latifolia TaxID=37657 RepID=UPI003D77EBBE